MPSAFDGHSFILGGGTETGLVGFCGRWEKAEAQGEAQCSVLHLVFNN